MDAAATPLSPEAAYDLTPLFEELTRAGYSVKEELPSSYVISRALNRPYLQSIFDFNFQPKRVRITRTAKGYVFAGTSDDETYLCLTYSTLRELLSEYLT